MRHIVAGTFLLSMLIQQVGAQPGSEGRCSTSGATNVSGAQCSIACRYGQKAVCQAGSPPQCSCVGDLNFTESLIKEKRTTPLAATPPASLQETDVVSEINKKLAQLRDYHLRTQCEQVETGRACRIYTYPCGSTAPPPGSAQPLELCYEQSCTPTYETRCTNIMGKLTVGGQLRIEKEPTVQTKEPNWDAFPNEFIGVRSKYRNCGPERQVQVYTHTERSKVGTRVVKQRVLKLGIELFTEVSFQYAVSGKGSTKFTGAVETTNTKEQNNEVEQTFTKTDTVNIPPMHLQVWQHEFVQSRVDVPFEGHVQLDAPVGANAEGVSLISSVLPSPSDRTFQFNGYISDSNLYEGSTELRATRITEKECRERAPTEPDAYRRR